MGNQRRGIVFLLLMAMLAECGRLQCQPCHASKLERQIESANDKIQDLEENVSEANEEISAYEQQQESLERDVNEKQEKIAALSAELDDTNTRLEEKREDIDETKEALEKNIEETKEQYEHMKLRIRYMYEKSMTSMFEYIFEAGSLAEALRRVNYFQAVTDYDREKVREYKQMTKMIRKEKEQLEEDEEQLTKLQAEQEERMAQINEEIELLKADISKKLAQIGKSKEKKKQYQQELKRQREYEEELERQKAEEDRKRQEEIRRQEAELARQLEAMRQAAAQQESESQSDGNSSSTNQTTNLQVGSYAASESDIEALSTIIYCEAGGEPYEGQVAVGSVVMNRVASSSFPNTITGVIYQSGQFSPVASGRYANALASGLGSNCIAAARAVLNGTRNVSCLYFRVNNGTINGTVIGHHVFY